MRRRVRNEPDPGPMPEGTVITYSRVPRDGGRPAERQEPYLDAREVPYRDDDLRAYDPERGRGDVDEAVDELVEPRRGRVRGRRGGARGAVLLGAVALAAGMVILAYAYGIATRVDTPPPTTGATAAAPDGADAMRTTLPADDAARSIPVTGAAPPADSAAAPAAPADGTTATEPPPARPAATTVPPTPKPQPDQTASAPAAAGAAGVPMDGDSGAQPALVAPVPVNTTPSVPETAPPATARAEPPPVKKPAAAPTADTGKAADTRKPANGTDDLMTNIERLLSRDAATAGAANQQPAADAATVPGEPTPIVPQQQAGNAAPPLPDPNAPAAAGPVPPADVGPPLLNRLIPPADIPNVPPSGTGTGTQ